MYIYIYISTLTVRLLGAPVVGNPLLWCVFLEHPFFAWLLLFPPGCEPHRKRSPPEAQQLGEVLRAQSGLRHVVFHDVLGGGERRKPLRSFSAPLRNGEGKSRRTPKQRPGAEGGGGGGGIFFFAGSAPAGQFGAEKLG